MKFQSTRNKTEIPEAFKEQQNLRRIKITFDFSTVTIPRDLGKRGSGSKVLRVNDLQTRILYSAKLSN